MFTVKKAVREAMPILAAFWGPSFSGKTRSALEFARGLVGPKGKICLIDTENKRALVHAEEAGGWDHLDFQPPFNPARYIEAYNTAQKQGPYDAIIIDSGSHVWEGEGGVLDMADKNASKGLGKWKPSKTEYKRMINHLLRSPTHVIFCLRSKELTIQKGNGDIKSMGMVPICEKNLIYEMTVSFLIGPDHKPLVSDTEHFVCSPLIPRVKLPVSGALKPGDMISQTTGAAVAKWASGGVKWDKELAALQQAARDLASAGTETYEKYWASLTDKQKTALESIREEMEFLAAQADEDIQRLAQEEVDEVENKVNAETTASLNDDIPLNTSTQDDVSHETEQPDEKPDDPSDSPNEDEKPAETAEQSPDEKEPKNDAPATDDKPEGDGISYNIQTREGGTIKCKSIEEWEDKMLKGIPTIKTKESLEAMRKRHGSIFSKLHQTHPTAVVRVGQAIDAGLAAFTEGEL